MEPEFFLDGGAGAEPGFEVAIGSLPVGPVGGDGAHGAGFGAKIVNVIWLQNEGDLILAAGEFCEVVQDEFGIFGEIKVGIESKFLGDFGMVEFVDGRIHAAVNGEKI